MINGIINVKKEKGFTSHDVVAKLRGIVGQRKIGHTGTLDPDATGVLPVCLGKATKLCDMLTEKDKTYETVLLFGVETDTQDISGTVLMEKSCEGLTEEGVRKCIQSFVGAYDQVPPMYSALKVQGKKLYELAREGKVVERAARTVNILEIEIKKVDLPRVTMKVTCSKGTYIRTLCHDIGQMLGCGGCMEELVRTRVGIFDIQDSVTLGEIQELKVKDEIGSCIRATDSVFERLERYEIPEGLQALASNGNSLYLEGMNWQEDQQIRAYMQSGEFVGIYRYQKNNGCLKLEKMFLDR